MTKIRYAFVLFFASAAIVALTACQQWQQAQTDIFNIGNTGIVIAQPQDQPQTQQQILSVQQRQDFAEAGIIAINDNNLNLLQKISDPQYYDTVILLAATDYKTENGKIFTYETEGVLLEKDVRFVRNHLGDERLQGPVHVPPILQILISIL